MPMTLSGTGGVTFNDSSVQSAAGIGYGQTWQNVTGSRVSGTTYTNSTGKPIMVMAISAQGAYPGISLYIAGTAFPAIAGGYHPGSGADVWCSAIIPNGTTYRVDNFATFWELR